MSDGRRRLARLCVVLAAITGAVATSPAHQSQAFTIGNHEAATSVLEGFLRSGVYDEIEDQHDDWADAGERQNVPWIHADDCAFDETAAQINSFQTGAVTTLTPGVQLDPWAAADQFGRSLHPSQDFYAHSNWVELGFPVGATARASDLVDFGTRLAGANGLGPWRAPGPLGLVRRDIRSADFVAPRLARTESGFLEVIDANDDGLTNATDATVSNFPAGWRVGLLPHPTRAGKAGFVPGVDATGDGQFTSLPTFGPHQVPVLQSGTDFRLLISAVGARPATTVFKNQCDPYERDATGKRTQPLTVNSCTNPKPTLVFPDHYSCIAYHGSRFALTHDGSDDSELGKDKSSDGPTRFPKALALAKLQTAYEWCRLVNRAGERAGGADGVLLALWVKEGASPHPERTPCSHIGAKGPVGVQVSVVRVDILQDQDIEEDEPGEINLSLVLYDPPSRFHQSVKSGVGPIFVSDDGGSASTLDGAKVPAPVRFCPGPTGRFRVALHGWDDDEGGDNGAEQAANGDYNRDNSTPDDVLIGFTAEHSMTDVPLKGSSMFTTVSKDTAITYGLTRTDGC